MKQKLFFGLSWLSFGMGWAFLFCGFAFGSSVFLLCSGIAFTNFALFQVLLED